MNNMNNLADKFWERFSSVKNDSIANIAVKTGISENTMEGWKVKGRLPKMKDAVTLCEYLGVSLDWLILGKSSENFNDRLVKAFKDSDELTKQIIIKLLDL